MMEFTPALESEKTILGAILLDNSVLRMVSAKLCPADFHSDFHRAIFGWMVKIFNKHNVVDIPMLIDELKVIEEDEQYIYQLANNCPSVANVSAHADIVREKSVQWKLRMVARELSQRKREKVSAADHLSAFLEESAAEIRSTALTHTYLVSMLVEITKAIAATVAELPEESC